LCGEIFDDGDFVRRDLMEQEFWRRRNFDGAGIDDGDFDGEEILNREFLRTEFFGKGCLMMEIWKR